jgi:very-short-patch-repair endonuclease
MRGGIASRASLLAAGCTDRQIRSAIAARRLQRVRPGWFTDGTAPPDVVRALRAGGWLSCVSALTVQGVWTMPHGLHLAMRRGLARPRGDFRIHWVDRPTPRPYPMDAPAPALRLAVGCLDQRAAVVALDSVLNRRLMSADAVHRLLAESPRGRRLSRLVDVSESGTETLARLALRRLRIAVRTQVTIAGVGRVDLLVGDRLVLEIDGRQWHDRESTFESDRARDRALVALGYLVMRASYAQVMHEWPVIERQLLTIVRRGAHRWPSGRR